MTGAARVSVEQDGHLLLIGVDRVAKRNAWDLAEVLPAVRQHGPAVLAGGGAHDPFGLWGPPVAKPVVMAVQGIAFTLSIELALASDVVVTADDVRFRQLEVGRGILPFGGATLRAPAQLGWGNAMRFLLSSEDADEGLRSFVERREARFSGR